MLPRLLNFDADKWVHLNCALWSNEVYETMNGALMYVDSACKRGGSIECVICHKSGATAGCFRPRCPNVYHIACAQQDNVTFFEDKVSVLLNFFFCLLFVYHALCTAFIRSVCCKSILQELSATCVLICR